VPSGRQALSFDPEGAEQPTRNDVYAFGDAGFFGSTGRRFLNSALVGMATTANGKARPTFAAAVSTGR
jgi:hypothetical protein